MNTSRQYGFIAPVLDKEKDYFLGGFRSAPFEVLQEDGQWDKFLSPTEIQHNAVFDSYNCTAYGTLNSLELLMIRKFGIKTNFSERYTGVCAGTYPPGNSPQVVIENIRTTSGLIEEISLPFTSFDTQMTLDQYYSPKPMEDRLIRKGKKFLEEYTIKHEWVYQSGEERGAIKLKTALKSSPLGVSVNAWYKDGDLYVKKGSDNHWCCLVGYEDEKFWKVYDSYDGGIKKLAWNYDFGFIKRYHIEKQTIKKISWYDWLRDFNLCKVYGFGKYAGANSRQ